MDTTKKTEIFDQKPGLKKILATFGTLSIFEFYKKTYPTHNTIPIQLKDEFLKTYESVLLTRFDKEVTERTVQDMRLRWYVGTADHMGPLTHPFFFNNALVESLLSKENGYSTIQYFPCSLISLDNSSYPRGFFYSGENGIQKNIALLERGKSKECVYNHTGFKRSKLEKLTDTHPSLKKLITSWDQVGGDFFCKQITKINYNLWKEIDAPVSLIYIELETIATQLLLDHHVKNPESPIYKILFTKKGRALYAQYFKHITGAHSGNETGSFMFWYLEKKQRNSVRLEQDTLCVENEKIMEAITPENITVALNNQTLVPTMALSFMVISFYYGITCGGGFSQIDYLGEMKNAYIKILKDLENLDSEIKKVQSIQTNIFRGEIGVYFNKFNILGSSIDFYIDKEPNRWNKLYATITTDTVSAMLEPMYPYFYKIIMNKTNTCTECGNNPTNHFFSYIGNTSSVFFQKSDKYLLGSFLGKTLGSILDYATVPYMRLTQLFGITQWNTDKKKASTRRSEVIWEEAEKRGIKMKQLVIFKRPVEFYVAQLKNGKKITFESIPETKPGWRDSTLWMDDKYALKKILKKNNIPVGEGASINNQKQLKELLSRIATPVITKPRIGSRGRHTSTYLTEYPDILTGFISAKKLCHFVIVEEHLEGSVYRGTLINGKLVGILEGVSPQVTGDGTHTIKELIELKNLSKKTPIKDIEITQHLKDFIKRAGYAIDSIPKKNTKIYLSEKIGISYGGTSRELIEKAHPKLIEYMTKAGKIIDAGVIGFDFIIPDPTLDPDTQKWGIIECNSLPFINLHHDPIEGTPINVAKIIWDEIEKIHTKKS